MLAGSVPNDVKVRLKDTGAPVDTLPLDKVSDDCARIVLAHSNTARAVSGPRRFLPMFVSNIKDTR